MDFHIVNIILNGYVGIFRMIFVIAPLTLLQTPLMMPSLLLIYARRTKLWRSVSSFVLSFLTLSGTLSPSFFCQSICPPLFPDNLITLCQVIKLVTLNAMRLCGVALASNFIPVIVYFSNFCSSLQLVHYKNNTVPLCV